MNDVEILDLQVRNGLLMRRLKYQHVMHTSQTRQWWHSVDTVRIAATKARSVGANMHSRALSSDHRNAELICGAEDEIFKWQQLATATSHHYKTKLQEIQQWRNALAESQKLVRCYEKQCREKHHSLLACMNSSADAERAIVLESSYRHAKLSRNRQGRKIPKLNAQEISLCVRSKVVVLNQCLNVLIKQHRKSIFQPFSDDDNQPKRVSHKPGCEIRFMSKNHATVSPKPHGKQVITQITDKRAILGAKKKEYPCMTNSRESQTTSRLVSGAMPFGNRQQQSGGELWVGHIGNLASHCDFLYHQLHVTTVAKTCWKEECKLLRLTKRVHHLVLRENMSDSNGITRDFAGCVNRGTFEGVSSPPIVDWLELQKNLVNGMCKYVEQDTNASLWNLVAAKTREVNFGLTCVIGLNKQMIKLCQCMRVLNNSQNQGALLQYLRTNCRYLADLGGTHLIRLDLSSIQLHDITLLHVVKLLTGQIPVESSPMQAHRYYPEAKIAADRGWRIPPLVAHKRKCDFLTHIVLSGNFLGDFAACILASNLIPLAEILVLLDLRQNSISLAGGQALERGVKQNKSILSSFVWQIPEKLMRGMIISGWRDAVWTYQELLMELDAQLCPPRCCLTSTMFPPIEPLPRMETCYNDMVPCTASKVDETRALQDPLLIDLRHQLKL